jgi:hypothetical protein
MVELSALPALLEQLPELFLLSDVLFYVFGVLFFGSLAVKGFRGYMHFIPFFGLRVLMGIVSMMGGLSLKGFFPFLNSGIYQLFRADILAGSFVSSLILAGGLYLISFRLINVNSLKKRVDEMQSRIEKAKKMPSKMLGWRDPLKMAGVGILVVFVGFSAVGFRGFPSISEGFLSFIGITRDDLTELSRQFEGASLQEEDLPPGCMGVMGILQAAGPDITKLQKSENMDVIQIIEDGSASSVLDMRIAAVGGKEYFLAVTEGQKICSATRSLFCGCLNIPRLVS